MGKPTNPAVALGKKSWEKTKERLEKEGISQSEHFSRLSKKRVWKKKTLRSKNGS